MRFPPQRAIWAGLSILAAGLLLARFWQEGRPAILPVAEEPIVVAGHFGDALLPLPPVPRLPPDKVALGRALFFDPRLSHDNTIACATCHDLTTAGHDARRFSVGVGGAVGTVNAPSVFNAGLNFVQFWDGRAASLEEQAAGPVHNPVEMASNWNEVIAKLSADTDFGAKFRRVYPDGLTPTAIVDAIATFERTLLTVNSPFDKYLRGDAGALDALAQEGYRQFRDLGCASCHQGVNIGGNMFQRFGVMSECPSTGSAGGETTKSDLGRYNVTGLEEDRRVFKVPSLRNVALTAPYFHNGSVASIDEAVIAMGRCQLGRELSAAEIRALVAFLNSLTGERPASAGP
jgi:cytochrome c peroxidase